MDNTQLRTELLLGSDVLGRFASARVIIFGVGGVGSWCAEALVRSGVGHLTIVDSDVVCPSNINRQLMATTLTVGRPKVDALRERLLQINPDADVQVVQKVYSAGTSAEFGLDGYDYVIDAIDSLRDKAHLILTVCQMSRPVLFSSMGAALKMDATQIRVVEFWDAKGDPLARALRKKFKHEKTLPAKRFKVVFSPELRENAGAADAPADTATSPAHHASTNGSMAHITGVFGLMLAGLVLQDLEGRKK